MIVHLIKGIAKADWKLFYVCIWICSSVVGFNLMRRVMTGEKMFYLFETMRNLLMS